MDYKHRRPNARLYEINGAYPQSIGFVPTLNLPSNSSTNLTFIDIQTGAYQVNYQFYRQLAGDETTLLTTTQQNDQGYFTIWEDTNAIEILDNG